MTAPFLKAWRSKTNRRFAKGDANLTKAKAVLETRAQERYATEQVEYQAKLHEWEEKARQKGRKPRGHPPQPPQPGPRDQDQYNFTDPDSRIMKNSTNEGFDQH